MVKDLAVTYVILGHSERRQYFAETNETVNKKVKSAVAHGIVPIVCCGETLAQREAGQAESFIAQQIREALAGVEAKDAAALVIAYEPIWAIGTGKTATSEQAEEICQLIRQTILDMYNGPVADAIRVLYGGSVKGSNVNELMAKKNIDGALVGGASLKADSFMEIVNFVRV
jgi:triosephosphate isomerase